MISTFVSASLHIIFVTLFTCILILFSELLAFDILISTLWEKMDGEQSKLYNSPSNTGMLHPQVLYMQ